MTAAAHIEGFDGNGFQARDCRGGDWLRANGFGDDLVVANTALATIQKDLSANVLELQWMMNCFGLCICVPLLTMGKLGDAYGKKKLFLCGLYGRAHCFCRCGIFQ